MNIIRTSKVEIALRVGQFWSEIKLVITNRTPATWSCDFVITRLISNQIALHSVQLPLLIKDMIHIEERKNLDPRRQSVKTEQNSYVKG